MNAKFTGAVALGLLGVLAATAQTGREAATSGEQPVTITRFFTGADHRTHADHSDVTFTDGTAKLPAVAAEFHWMLRGKSPAPHHAVGRMYVITLSGTGEIGLTDGKKFPVGPGTVDIVEDTTGQGHLTNNIDDRLAVWLHLADSSAAAQGAEAKPAAMAASAAGAKPMKPVAITRIFNGPDGVDHAENLEIPMTADGSPKIDLSGAELHWQLPSASTAWHPGPRRQYVITLRGTGEVEVSGGKKIPVMPGNIDLIDDVVGKGHITRNFTPRLTLWVPLPAGSGK